MEENGKREILVNPEDGSRLRAIFYNYHTPTGPYITVCMLVAQNKTLISRGISVCSLQEPYITKVGRNQSFNRARDAFVNKRSDLPIIVDDTRYDCEYVTKKFTAKSKELADEFRGYLDDVGFRYSEHYENRRKKGSDELTTRYIFKYVVPRSFPIAVASAYYENKSEYKPQMIAFEEEIISDRFNELSRIFSKRSNEK